MGGRSQSNMEEQESAGQLHVGLIQRQWMLHASLERASVCFITAQERVLYSSQKCLVLLDIHLILAPCEAG